MDGLSRRGAVLAMGGCRVDRAAFPGARRHRSGRDVIEAGDGQPEDKSRKQNFFADPGTRGRRVLTRNDRQGDTADASRWTAESAMGGVVSSG